MQLSTVVHILQPKNIHADITEIVNCYQCIKFNTRKTASLNYLKGPKQTFLLFLCLKRYLWKFTEWKNDVGGVSYKVSTEESKENIVVTSMSDLV